MWCCSCGYGIICPSYGLYGSISIYYKAGLRVSGCMRTYAYNLTLLHSFHYLYLQDAGGQGVGFLLGSLCVNVALTSEACYKGLPRTQNGDVVTFRGQLIKKIGHIVCDFSTNCLI